MNNPRRIQRHLVKALAAGAVLVAAALPLAIAGVASAAADSISGIVFSPSGTATNSFGTGATGTYDISGAFAGDGGNITVTSSAPGLSFTVPANTSPTDIVGDFTSTAATVPGTYNLTVTDDGGTVIDSNAIIVNAAPSITAITPATVADTTGDTPLTGATFTGSFVGTPTVTLTSTVNGTTIETSAEGVTAGTTLHPATSDTMTITPENPVNHTPGTPGTYTATITNPDGGTYTSGALFTVTGNEISEVTPSAIPGSATGITTLTVSGGGFVSGTSVTLGACGGGDVTVVPNTTTVTSGSTLTFEVTNTGAEGIATSQCDLTVTNSGTNVASYLATGAFGVNEANTLAPSVTASSLTTGTAITPGAPATTVTFTGTGFSQYTTPSTTKVGTATDTHSVVSGPCLGGQTGTTVTCELAVSSLALTGAHSASLENGTASTSLANSFTVAGPSITSAAPAALAIGAPVGTTVVLTGTGFANTSSGGPPGGTTGLGGNFVYVNATTEDFVVTAPPTTQGAATLTIDTVDAYGATEVSAPFTLTIDSAPTVSSIAYVTGTTGVGVGAAAQTITINGQGFETGATIGSFTNATGTADANVTAKVTTVNALGTVITATVAVAKGDTNAIDGYVVTNPDGGSAKAFAVAPAGLTIDAAPTLTAVSPVTATPASTNAFTITGTGFQTGATVVLSSDGTCGTAAVASATSITVSCTIGEPGTAAVTLSVVNPDGGTATSGTILAAKSTTPVSTFHVTGAHGTAIAGKTVTMTISGTGFYGQPKITSTAVGTKVGVSKDSGKVLTIRVTTKAGIRGEHTFTIRLANGKTGKANYAIKK